MKKLGIIGARGMVGSVLVQRMLEENDFSSFKNYFFSTGLKGQDAPKVENGHETYLDSNDIEQLSEMDIIITCQGGDYTKEIHPKLRETSWNGYWIDAASALRMDDNAVIILDPVNANIIQESIDKGVKDFVGGNCTVSLMLMAMGGLFKEGLVEWMTSMTYQAASGAGARAMLELLDQYSVLDKNYQLDKNIGALEVEKNLGQLLKNNEVPTENFGNPLALSLLPWIDTKMENGQSREEWKAQAEANKILQTDSIIPIDGTCVRVGSLRCHSQAFTIKLKKDVDIKTIEQLIGSYNDWSELIPNEKEITNQKLTPTYASGTLKIPVGRVRKMSLGSQYLNAFTVGDQLLWGAAEPLRCMLKYFK